MRLHTKIVLILFVAGLVAFASCRRFEDYPAEPQIAFDNFVLLLNEQTGITEQGVLSISYKDGDGDIGLDPGDTLEPFNYGSTYYYNMIIDYYEKQNGEWKLVPLVYQNPETQENDTLTFSVRIPNLTPTSGNQSIKGIIQDTMYIYNPLSQFDTIKFSVYIFDRALHKSNVVETPEIIRITN